MCEREGGISSQAESKRGQNLAESQGKLNTINFRYILISVPHSLLYFSPILLLLFLPSCFICLILQERSKGCYRILGLANQKFQRIA